MQKEKYSISGMSCAACAARVQHAAGSVEGVISCQVNLLQNSMQITFDESKVNSALIEAAVQAAGYAAQKQEAGTAAPTADEQALRTQKRELICSFILTLALMTVSMGPMLGWHLISDALTCALVQGVLAAAVMLLQRQYFIRGFRALGHLAPNMDSLVALGAAASFVYSLYQSLQLSPGLPAHVLHGEFPLYFESAASILCLVGIGKYFEHKAKVKSSAAISSLLDLSPRLIRVRRDGQEKLLSPDGVVQGDVVILRAGESLGVDGEVTAGQGFMDESSLTGESLGQKKVPGSRVLSGTQLSQGYLEIRADAVGADTTFAKILQLMDDTVSQKVPIARMADVIAYYFVPVVIALAVLVFLLWYCVISLPFNQALNFALCVLVVSCPCALGLATPTAVMVGMGRAARLGILFRNLAVLETLNRADVVVFDKTGTLTTGSMQLLESIEARAGIRFLAHMLTASIEDKSSHPIARALTQALADQVKTKLEVEDYEEEAGLGVKAVISGEQYAIGNLKQVQARLATVNPQAAARAAEISSLHEARGRIVLHLTSSQDLLMSYILGDSIKPDAAALISDLKKQGLTTLMLTGDRKAAAQYVAQELGLDGFKAEMLSDGKLAEIKKLQQQGRRVVMLGDGVNDALCLTQADVGIGVHGASDVAVSACDVVFMNNSLLTLERAREISRLTYRNIKQNLFWAFIYNVLTIPVAAGLFYHSYGLALSPMLAALLMSLSSICVVTNALRLNFVNINGPAAAGQDHARSPASNPQEELIMTKVISIEGMHCAHCTASVLSALSALPGAQNVSVSLEEKCARGDFPALISDEMITGVVAGLGFTVTGITTAA